MRTSTQDQWSANAGSYAKGSQYLNQNLSNAPGDRLLAHMNGAYPFSAAKAILDVGSGSGDTVRRLIERYGSQLPPSTRL